MSERTIRRWVKNGFPRAEGGGYPAAILDIFKKNDGSADSKEQLREEEIGYKSAKRRLIEMELAIKEGRLITKEQIEKERIERILAVKRVLLSLPRKLPGRLRGKGTRKMQEIIKREVEQAIGVFSGDG